MVLYASKLDMSPMSDYEIIALYPGTLSEEEVAEKQNTLQTLLTNHTGSDIAITNVGKRRLAYTIDKQRFAWYVQATFNLEAGSHQELNQSLLRDTSLVRFVLRATVPGMKHAFTTGERKRGPKKDAVKSSAPRVAAPKKAGPVDMKELDKKLDSIVEGKLDTEKL